METEAVWTSHTLVFVDTKSCAGDWFQCPIRVYTSTHGPLGGRAVHHWISRTPIKHCL